MPLDFGELRAMLDGRAREVALRERERGARVLEARARAVAARAAVVEQVAMHGDYVIARRGAMQIGIPAGSVVEVRPVQVVRIPGATSVVQGAFHARARVHALVDLLPLFGVPASADHGATLLAALVDGRAGRIGLRIDEVVELRSIAVHELDAGRRGRGVAFVDHIATDLTQLLDLDALFALPAVTISGETGQ